jgi:putative inorganic carbon (HCO3(-)) transporter
MITRARGPLLLQASLLATAAMLGLLAAVQPLVAIGVVVAILFVYVVFNDLVVGVAVLGLLSFLEVLPQSGGLSLAKGAGLILALAWIARISLSEHGERGFVADHSYLAWFLVAFFVWGLLTLLWAEQTGLGLTALSRYAPNLLLIPIAYTAVRTGRDLKLVLALIVFGAVIAAVFGLIQPPSSSIENARATGTIGDPNELAAALLVGLALGAGFAVAQGSSLALRLGGLLAVPLCAAGIFLSASRGGLIALGVMLVVATFTAGRWRVAVTALFVAVVAGGALYFTQLAPLPARERLLTANGGSGRSELWKVGLRIARAHPVGGVGVGNAERAAANYVLRPGVIHQSSLIFSVQPFPVHNTYLQVLAEMGAVGLLLFLAVVVVCLGCALRAARVAAKRRDVTMEALSRAVFLAVVGTVVADFFISVEFSKLLWLLLGLCPAVLVVARRGITERA